MVGYQNLWTRKLFLNSEFIISKEKCGREELFSAKSFGFALAEIFELMENYSDQIRRQLVVHVELAVARLKVRQERKDIPEPQSHRDEKPSLMKMLWLRNVPNKIEMKMPSCENLSNTTILQTGIRGP